MSPYFPVARSYRNKAHIHIRIRYEAAGLDPEHGNRVIAELSTQETVATSAIEGVKLDPDLVRSSIMRRLGLGVSKERVERIGAAAKGVIDVLADSTQNSKPLTLDRLFAWHTAIFPAGRSGLTPVDEMDRLLKWIHSSTSMDATSKACIAHLWFETLHRFEDGNGRLSRAISDHILAQGA